VTGRTPRRPTLAAGEPTRIVEAKLFMNGRSQAVRLPAAYRFAGKSVYIKKWRGAVILLPKENPWRPLVDSLGKLSPDSLAVRSEPATPDDRVGLDSLFD
jgi:antitoxin VapB